mmetsp:Transcript_45610/g.151202  ORF Transcript_45610/g.151202 Transcript_45610/m.151202 type:complete len:314 (+) Transcript_45610:228-1169(+)
MQRDCPILLEIARGVQHVWVQRAADVLSRRQAAVEPRLLPRPVHRAGPLVKEYVVAAPARRVAAPAARRAGRVAWGAVHHRRVEEEHVARRHVPAEQLVLAAGDARVDVRHGRVAFRAVVHVARVHLVRAGEVCDAVRQAPSVRAFDIREASLPRHLVEGEPDRADLLPAQMPVGRVVVPRGRRRGARLLDEELVVEDVRRPRTHCPCGDGARARAEHKVCKDGVAVPEELVVVEASSGAGGGGVLVAERAWLGEVRLGAFAHRLHPRRKRAAQDDGAVLIEARNVGVGEHGGVGAGQRGGRGAGRRQRARCW